MATHSLSWIDHPPAEFLGGAVTVGNFDGVHRGHQALVSVTRRWADQLNGPAVAITFDPPPAQLLLPNQIRLPLMTLTERCRQLHAVGIDHVAVLKTDAALLSLSPEAFFEDVITRQFQARAMIEGYNFCFGRGRAGDTKLLRSFCQQVGISFEEVSPLIQEGEPVSSSRVRTAVLAGDMELAVNLLGRAFEITGVVVQGAQRGRTLGFPTANLERVATLLPRDGVYAARVPVGRSVYPAAVNIGANPTFGENARKLEVHLIGYTGDLYGQELTVAFLSRIRETRSFAGVEALKSQLQRDLESVTKAFSAKPGALEQPGASHV